MFKQALSTYWKSLHPRNIKRMKDKTFRVILTLFFIIIPVALTGVSDNVNELYTMTKFIPLIVLEITNLDNGIRLPKPMYLTPTKKEDRAKYIRSLLGIKITVVVGLALLFELLWGMYYGVEIKDFIINIIIYASIGIADCVGVGVLGNDSTEQAKIIQKVGKEHLGWNLANLLVGVLLILGFVPMNTGENAEFVFEIHPIVLAGMFLLLIADYMILKQNYGIMMKAACDYELAYLKKDTDIYRIDRK